MERFKLIDLCKLTKRKRSKRVRFDFKASLRVSLDVVLGSERKVAIRKVDVAV
jgi:hypothetical protein